MLMNEPTLDVGYTHLGEMLTQKLEVIDHVSKEQQLQFCSGYQMLDNSLRGFAPGKLLVLGARPGMGKTAFAMNLIYQLAVEQNQNVGMVSFDAIEDLFTSRLLSIHTGMHSCRVAESQFDDSELMEIKQGAKELSEANIVFTDEIYWLEQIELFVTKVVKQQETNIIFLDELQMIKSTGRYGNREMEVSAMMRELKRIAKEHKVCLVVLSQLSRAVETRGGDKRPVLSDLRESGSIEQMSDAVMFLYRAEYYGFSEDEMGNSTNGIAELIIAKNRTGIIRTIEYEFDVANIRFKEIGKEELLFENPFDQNKEQ
jgi:replicative DNA helicase